jgi:hypothetical protein
VKVSAVNVPDSASDPAHPEHDRWVKERTLKMEIDHARAVGLSLRDAEAENIRLLERTEQIAKNTPAPAKKQKQNIGHNERLTQRGVTKRAVGREKPESKRCSCGRCAGCMRAQRIMLIMQRGREDSSIGDLAKKLMLVSLQASSGTGQFLGLNKRDRERALHVYVDAVCDASARLLGAWR